MDEYRRPPALEDLVEAVEQEEEVTLGAVFLGSPTDPFFIADTDGTVRYQGRTIGHSKHVRNALLRQAHWIEQMETSLHEEELSIIPFFGTPPVGYATVCEVDGEFAIELVLPHTDDRPGRPFNRVMLCEDEAYLRSSKRTLTDAELMKFLEDWAQAGVN